MKGTVIAVSRRLGTVVVQFDVDGCMVFELPVMAVRDIAPDAVVHWHPDDKGHAGTLLHWPDGAEITARVQRQGLTRGEALSTMAII